MEITKELLEELYIKKDMGITLISRYLGVGARVIRTRLDRFSIPKRPFISKGRGNRLGAKLSDETKNKISKSHKGKSLSLKHKEAISDSMNSKKEWINNGYVFIRKPEHPNAKHRGRIKRATLVLEKKIGRFLEKGELAHHVNHVRNDDRPENLMLVTINKHNSLTASERWKSGELREIHSLRKGR